MAESGVLTLLQRHQLEQPGQPVPVLEIAGKPRAAEVLQAARRAGSTAGSELSERMLSS